MLATSNSDGYVCSMHKLEESYSSAALKRIPTFRVGNPFMNYVMQKVLRQQVPLTAPDPWTVDIYYEEVRLHHPDDPFAGPYIMPLVTLRTSPCRWASNAGCVMCGYHLGARRTTVEPEHLIAQTKDAIRRLDPKIYPSLVFTSNGSFLDHYEVPDDLRPRLLRMLRNAGFRFVVMETRPEFITRERLHALATAFSPKAEGRKPLSISFGVESSNNFVQRYCINKGRRSDDYERAFEILHSEGYGIDCYVLLGKPFMTAEEDIIDAIKTIKCAISNGVEYIFVMITNMVDYSLTSYLEERGRYKLPSLWRAVDLLEMLDEHERKFVQIKGISHAPVEPKKYARTCEICTEHVKSALNFWNQTGDFEHIRNIHPCSCREKYQREELGERPRTSLPQRVHEAYRQLAAELDIDPRMLPDLREMQEQWEA